MPYGNMGRRCGGVACGGAHGERNEVTAWGVAMEECALVRAGTAGVRKQSASSHCSG
jgi:hypothetical protein